MGFFGMFKQLFGVKRTVMEAKAAQEHWAAQSQQGLDGNVDMSQPQWEPIQGITLDKYAEIMAKIAKSGVVGPEAVFKFAESMGVPEGQWGAIQAGWQARMGQHADVRNRFGVLYNQFMA